jgi:transposase
MEISTKSEKFGEFFTLCSPDERNRKIKYVFMDRWPVIHFDIDSASERKIALVHLVERGICNIKTACELCGFHRNTASKIIQTKKILGIEAVLSDDRGLKKPYKYIGQVSSHIEKLLSEHPEWKDQDVADQASRDLDMKISRSAVARIRSGTASALA